MSTNTLARGARGGAVTLLGQVFVLIIQFVGVVVLSRLLTPADFGLIAMIAVFVGIGELIRDFGMPTAALQARQLTDQQASNVFWVTAALSLASAALLVLATPFIVLLYDEPRLALIVPAMAGVLVVNGLQAQFQVRLARSMRFKEQTAITVSARLAGLAAGIVGAVVGWGYWALVVQLAATAAVLLVGSWTVTRWTPSPPRRGSNSLVLLRAGTHNGAANLLGYAADNADNLMIGAVWGSGPLGLYNRAFQLFMNSIMSFFTPLTRVVVPTANRAVAEGKNLSDILARAQTALCGTAIWVLLVTAATADPLVPLLLGEQWRESVPLLQILAVGGAFKALSQTNYWAYLIEQQSRQLFFSQLVTRPIQIALIVIAAFISVEAVAWAFAIGRAITWPVNVVWLWRSTGQPPWRFWLNGMRLILAAALGYLGAWAALRQWPLGEPWQEIVAGALISSVIYVAVVVGLPGGRRELAGAVSLFSTVLRRQR